MSVVKLHVAVVAIAVVAVVAGSTHAASAQNGQHWQYSYGTAFCEQSPIDPVNMVFVGAYSWYQVDEAFGWHLPDWSWSSSTPNQTGVDRNAACKSMSGERATGSGSALTRSHIRFLEYGYTEAEPDPDSRGYHVHGTAHHDGVGIASFCTDDGGCDSWYCGHAVSENGYNTTRDGITDGFIAAGYQILKFDRWDNARPMQQCDGTWQQSDGWVDYIRVTSPGPGGVD
jgi:hypothetical protein